MKKVIAYQHLIEFILADESQRAKKARQIHKRMQKHPYRYWRVVTDIVNLHWKMKSEFRKETLDNFRTKYVRKKTDGKYFDDPRPTVLYNLLTWALPEELVPISRPVWKYCRGNWAVSTSPDFLFKQLSRRLAVRCLFKKRSERKIGEDELIFTVFVMAALQNDYRGSFILFDMTSMNFQFRKDISSDNVKIINVAMEELSQLIEQIEDEAA